MPTPEDHPPSAREGPLPVIVTIDGPAGTGKSSVAQGLARALGLEFLDTGAMYRAVTLIALRAGVDLRDAEGLARLSRSANIRFDFSADPPEITAFGFALGSAIRSAEVSAAVSIVAAHPQVRASMVAAQRAVAVEHPRLVTEGRDQGSVVFPDAAVKFYLDATPLIRADRRAAQLRRAGQPADLEEILHAIIRRDEMDMGREIAPLRCPSDAIRLDTGPLTLAETVAELVRLARSAAPRQLAVGGAT